MIGLVVGIDYALFVVDRYREERRRGAVKLDAITRAGGTASRAVLFSGLTVVVALAGMYIVPNNIYRSLSIGAILVVIVTVVAALTLIPAVICLHGVKMDRRRADHGRRLRRSPAAPPISAVVCPKSAPFQLRSDLRICY